MNSIPLRIFTTAIPVALCLIMAKDCRAQIPGQPTTYQYPATTPPTSGVQGITYGANQAPVTQVPVVGFQPHTIPVAPASTSYFQTQGAPTAPPLLNSGQPVPQQPYPIQSAPQQPYPVQPYQVQPYSAQPVAPGYAPGQAPTLPPFAGLPPNAIPADITVTVPQNPSGRMMIGANYSSDNELVGEFIIDERNFDIMRWPRSFSDACGPTAWRGAGQAFRLEAVPGNELERYLISFSDPYFLGSLTSFSISGYFYQRKYTDWREQRSGAKMSIGRKMSNYLSLNAGLRLEGVTIDEPRVDTSSDLNAVLGYSNLFLASIGLVYDTRFTPFMPNCGTYFAMTYSHSFDDYDYGQGVIEYRHHRVIHQSTPTSGQHILSHRTKLGFSESTTPVFETFIEGGATTMRGFQFRGVSPIEGGVRVGGDFEWFSSFEYLFPLTPYDNHYHGVVFVDYGTVEETVTINSHNYRTAPGIGLRIDLPWAGIGAPLAFDYAVPVNTATGDIQNEFSFFVGLMR